MHLSYIYNVNTAAQEVSAAAVAERLTNADTQTQRTSTLGDNQWREKGMLRETVNNPSEFTLAY